MKTGGRRRPRKKRKNIKGDVMIYILSEQECPLFSRDSPQTRRVFIQEFKTSGGHVAGRFLRGNGDSLQTAKMFPMTSLMMGASRGCEPNPRGGHTNTHAHMTSSLAHSRFHLAAHPSQQSTALSRINTLSSPHCHTQLRFTLGFQRGSSLPPSVFKLVHGRI